MVVSAEWSPGGAEGRQRCSESRGEAPEQPGEETGQHGAQTSEPREGAPAGTVTDPGPPPPHLRTHPLLSWQVIGRSWQTSEADGRSQVERWRRVAEDKRRQMDAFRQELDSILDIVRYLQKEGVVLPVPAPTPPHAPGGLLKDLS